MNKHWNNQDQDDLETASSLSDLSVIALRILRRQYEYVNSKLKKYSGQTIYQVCGPITTGGHGNREKNLEKFSQAISKLITDGLPVFNQMPFEYHIKRIVDSMIDESDGQTKLLEEFYLPIFNSGMIGCLLFLPKWETSFGALWEYKQAEHLGIQRIRLSFDYVL